MSLKKEEVNQIKLDFINKCTRESDKDCRLIVPEKLVWKTSSFPMDNIEDKDEINDVIKKQIDVFNKERSFLFDFKIDEKDIVDTSKVFTSVVLYEMPKEIFPEYSDSSYPLYIRVTNIVADIKGDVNKESFYLPAIVDIVDEDEYVVEGEDVSDYGELLLLSFKRNFDVKENYKSEKGVEFVYELRHNEKGRNIYNEVTIKKEFGRYKAFMEIATDAHETKDEALKQLGRWLRALGRAEEIAVVKED